MVFLCSKISVAAHDCRCRCFLEYNLMTVEEFAKATGKTTEEVLKALAEAGQKWYNKDRKEG